MARTVLIRATMKGLKRAPMEQLKDVEVLTRFPNRNI